MHLLVLQHIAIEHPGSFRDFMRADGVNWDAVELDKGESIPSLDGYDAMIVMGGPMDIWEEKEHPWLIPEKKAIRAAVLERQMPYLGFCLGHQLLAVALDGEAGLMETPEVGILDVHLEPEGHADPLFKNMPTISPTLQWHSVEVQKLPSDSVALASSPACNIQAFRTGRHAYGLQYHMEMTEDTVPEWGCVPAYQHALRKTLGADALTTMESQVAERLSEFNQNAQTLYNNFMTIVRNNQAGSSAA